MFRGLRAVMRATHDAATTVRRARPPGWPRRSRVRRRRPRPAQEDDDHPADGDGPTIQALPPMIDPLPPMHVAPSRPSHREPMRSEPPTLMQSGEAMPSSQNDGPTMMAAPAARAAMIALSSDEVLAVEPDDAEEDQDENDGRAACARRRNPLQAPPTFPQVAPAAGRSGAPVPSQRRPPTTQAFAQSPARHRRSTVPPMLNPLGYQQTQQQIHRRTLQSAAEPSAGPARRRRVQRPDGHAAGHELRSPPGPRPERLRARDADAAAAARLQPAQRPAPDGAERRLHSPHVVAAHAADGRPHGRAGLRQPHDDGGALQAPSADVGRRGAVVLHRAAHRGRGDRDRLVHERHADSEAGQALRRRARASSPPAECGRRRGRFELGPFSSARSAFNTAVAQPGSSARRPSRRPVLPRRRRCADRAAGDDRRGRSRTDGPAGRDDAAGSDRRSDRPRAAHGHAGRPDPRAARGARRAQHRGRRRRRNPPPSPRLRPRPPRPRSPPRSVRSPWCACRSAIRSSTTERRSAPATSSTGRYPAGRHVLQLSAPNGSRKNLVVEVAPEQTKEVRMSMDK